MRKYEKNKKRYSVFLELSVIDWLHKEADKRGVYTAELIRDAIHREKRLADARDERRALKDAA